MNDAPSNPVRTREDCAWLCRQTIAEMMGSVIVSAEIVQRYAELADDEGLHRQLSHMSAYLRVAGSAYRDLARVHNEALPEKSEAA
jgi:hypothetical protein